MSDPIEALDLTRARAQLVEIVRLAEAGKLDLAEVNFVVSDEWCPGGPADGPTHCMCWWDDCEPCCRCGWDGGGEDCDCPRHNPENDPALLRAELDACRARLDVLVLALLAVEREAEHHKARDMAWDHVWELAHAAVWGEGKETDGNLLPEKVAP